MSGIKVLERLTPDETSFKINYEHWHRYIFARGFAKGKTVLDLGSGSGYGSNILAEVAKSVVGVDIDEESVKFSKQTFKRKNIEFLQGDVVNFGYKPKVDLITCFELIEHVNRRDQIVLLKNISNLLAKDGVLVVSTPNKRFSKQTDNPFHLHELKKLEFERLLKRSFKNVELFAQSVAYGSNIWSLKRKNQGQDAVRQNTESFLEFKNGRFSYPQKVQKKEIFYIAVCSNTKLPEINESTLIDTSERIFSELYGYIEILREHIADNDKHFQELERYAKSLEDRLGIKSLDK